MGWVGAAETSLALEEKVHGRRLGRAEDGQHVFVAGLARSGTTVLMRLLHNTGAFCSLTYRDMPFVLAPNLWASCTRWAKRDPAPRERAHGDSIMESTDSPEALEEVFWRVLCGPSYIGRRNLSPMQASPGQQQRFRRYVALVLKRYRGNRYLSKNNNNILRLPSLRQAFPRALALTPFRDPVQQALSLRAQHLRFSNLQRQDRFVRRYMAWLAHHEFGLERRPFNLPGAEDTADPTTTACWLRQWLAVYGYLWRQAENGEIEPVFVGYELLCRHPERVCERLAALLEVPREAFSFHPREAARAEPPDGVPGELLNQARDLFTAMDKTSRDTFAIPA